jgi:hypothetical protein
MRLLKAAVKLMSFRVFGIRLSSTDPDSLEKGRLLTLEMSQLAQEGVKLVQIGDDIFTGEMVMRTQRPVLRLFHRIRVIRELHFLRKWADLPVLQGYLSQISGVPLHGKRRELPQINADARRIRTSRLKRTSFPFFTCVIRVNLQLLHHLRLAPVKYN